MAETGLWDTKVPTRNRFMSRTFTWDSSFPINAIENQFFFHTDKGIYKYNNGSWISVMLEEQEAISQIVALV